MTGEARVSHGSTGGLRKTIQDIREIAGQHSDEDIHAMLKECSMDPNETAQRLLHLDTFHEVKKKNGRRKENMESRAFDYPGQQLGAGRGAKVVRGNMYFRTAAQSNGRRTMGGSKENGYRKMSKGLNTEIKTVFQSPRSGHIKVNGLRNPSSGEHSQGGAPEANDTISLTRNRVISASPAVSPFYSTSSVGVNIDVELSHSTSLHGDQIAVPNGNIILSDDKIQNHCPNSPMPTSMDTAMTQLTNCNSDGQPQQANFSVKDVEAKEKFMAVEEKIRSEDGVSAVPEEASKLNISDGHHVVFPDHLQVPEAYKKKLTFGSFDSIWALDGKQTSCIYVINSDTQVNDSSLSDASIAKTSTDSGGVSLSTTEEKEDQSHPQSLPTLPESAPHTGHALCDVVIKIDEPETEILLPNGQSELVNSANNGFSYAPHAQLQAHGSGELQGGNSIASSTPVVGPNSIVHPPGISPDLVSSPPPAPILRQTYHPNFFPYGHYYPQFIVPQAQQCMTHGGLPQQPSLANVYLGSAAAAASIKYPHQNHKQGSNAVTDGYIGVPSGYSPYIPYAFPYGLSPVVIPGNVVGDDDHANQAKENATTQQQIESSGEWMTGTGRTIAGMQVNPFYNLGFGQGHPMAFPPAPAGFGAFGGVYLPAAQAVPAPQPTVHPHIQSIGPGEQVAGGLPTSAFYQQQQQPQAPKVHVLFGTINNSRIQ